MYILLAIVKNKDIIFNIKAIELEKLTLDSGKCMLSIVKMQQEINTDV